MQTKSEVTFIIVAVMCSLSTAGGQQAATSPNADTATGAAGQLPPPTAGAGRAVVYIYREGSMVGALGHPYVFVDDTFLATMKNSNFAMSEVPPGTVVVAATTATTESEHDYSYLRQSSPPVLLWPKCEVNAKKNSCQWNASGQSPDKEDHGCGKIDWRHVEDAHKEDLGLCSSELLNTAASIDHWLDPNAKARQIALGMLIPGPIGNVILANGINMKTGNSSWLQMCGPNPFPSPASSPQVAQELRSCEGRVEAALRLVQLHVFLRIDVEAGKTYYVKWSVSSSGGKLALENEATGEKDIRGLHLAKD
jgi:hypothetical protein